MDFLVKVEHNVPEKQVQGIDNIYVLNLDYRTDRMKSSLDRFARYDIAPQRVSAVYGKTLPIEAFDAVGLRYEPGMGQDWVADFSHPEEGELEFLRKEVVGQTFFFKDMSKGAVGCALSQISAIQDGYDSGYETIWILEDDFDIKEDPHVLSGLIEQLNQLTDHNWDLLYTNMDTLPEEDIELESVWLWRPDKPIDEPTVISKRSIVNDQFTKISYRTGAYSYLLSRSGMKKMLDYFHANKIFLPYDHEISLVPDMEIYCTRKTVVTYYLDGASDIRDNP